MSGERIRLTTDRLLLHPLGPGGADSVADYYERNRGHFGPWDPARPREFFSSAFWREQLLADQDAMEADRRYRLFVFELRDPMRVIAHVHFANVVRGAFQACHLGFGIDAALEGHGVMTEALRTGIGWAFDELGVHRVEANHRPENVRSGALLKRLGFVPQGFARDYLLIDGDWRDHVLTALTNERWSPR